MQFKRIKTNLIETNGPIKVPKGNMEAIIEKSSAIKLIMKSFFIY